MRKFVRFSLVIFVAMVLTACSSFSKPAKSGLQVITNQTPSSVFLDGQYLEKTPFIEKSIQPGTYSLKIEPDDKTLVPYETSVTLHDGLLTVVTWKPSTRPELSGGVIYEMEPLGNNNTAEVSFVSIPDGAIIKLDGQETSFAPVILKDVQTGHVEFSATLPSYETQQHTLNVVPGYRMLVTIKLAKLPTDVPASSPAAGDLVPSPTPATASASQAATTNSSAPTPPYVTIQSTNYFEDDQEVLRVRSAPGLAGEGLGSAPVGSTYPYLSTHSSGWYEISFNGQSGWISNLYADITQE